MGLDPERLAQQVRLAGEPLVLAGLGRAGEAAREPELAVDRLAPDELGQVLARGLGLGLDGVGAGLAEPAHHLPIAGPEVAAGDAAVARRGALAGALAVEDLHAAAGAGKREAGAEPGVAGADDDDVALRLHGDLGRRGRRRVLPPVGRG